MARISRGVTKRTRHNKILKMAKGYRGRNKSNFRIAIERVEKGLQYAFRDRRARKRTFRNLWIQRINAGARMHGIKYSQLINGLSKAGIKVDRKVLADLAVHEPVTFKALINEAQEALVTAAKIQTESN